MSVGRIRYSTSVTRGEHPQLEEFKLHLFLFLWCCLRGEPAVQSNKMSSFHRPARCERS